MTNSDEFAWLLESDITSIGIVRYQRSSLECVRLTEDGSHLQVVQLLFLRVTRSELSLSAKPWLGKLRGIAVHEVAHDGGNRRAYEITFDAGSWLVEAEGCSISPFSSIPHGG